MTSILKLTTGIKNVQKEKNTHIILYYYQFEANLQCDYLILFFVSTVVAVFWYYSIFNVFMFTMKRRRCPFRAVCPESVGCTTSFRDCTRTGRRTSRTVGVRRAPSSTLSDPSDGQIRRCSCDESAALGERSSVWSCSWWCRRQARLLTTCSECSGTVSTLTGTAYEQKLNQLLPY